MPKLVALRCAEWRVVDSSSVALSSPGGSQTKLAFSSGRGAEHKTTSTKKVSATNKESYPLQATAV